MREHQVSKVLLAFSAFLPPASTFSISSLTTGDVRWMVRDNGGSFVFFITIAASSTDWSISYLSSVTAYKIKCNFQKTFSSGDSTLLFSPTGYCKRQVNFLRYDGTAVHSSRGSGPLSYWQGLWLFSGFIEKGRWFVIIGSFIMQPAGVWGLGEDNYVIQHFVTGLLYDLTNHLISLRLWFLICKTDNKITWPVPQGCRRFKLDPAWKAEHPADWGSTHCYFLTGWVAINVWCEIGV